MKHFSTLSLMSLVFPLIMFSSSLFAEEIDCFFGPAGGFSEKNHDRKMTLPNGRVRVKTLTSPIRDEIASLPQGGMIRVCMYNFDDASILKLLLNAALKKGARIEIIWDNVASWTNTIVAKNLSIIKKFIKAHNSASLDLGIKIITSAKMVENGRTYSLTDGTRLYGTMHEKFLVFYDGAGRALHCLNGSSNLSRSSEYKYAENRYYFPDNPELATRFHNEYATIWNDYGVLRIGSDRKIKTRPVPESSAVELLFNSEKDSSGLQKRIDTHLLAALDGVSPDGGTIEMAMFSFTHRGIAEKLVSLAKKYPAITIRILLDQSMLRESDKPWLMSGWIEEQIVQNCLDNISIRYKWRTNAYGWDEFKKAPGLDHFRSLLLHHKAIVVNHRVLYTGSYNYSVSAEKYNIENVMIFDSKYAGHSKMVQRFLWEFDAIWNKIDSLDRNESFIRFDTNSGYPVSVAHVVSLAPALAFRKRILTAFKDGFLLKVRKFVERARGSRSDRKGVTVSELVTKLKKSRKRVIQALGKLYSLSLITIHMGPGSGSKRYYLRD